MDLSLLVLQGKPQGKELPVRNSPFLIGRGPECHLRPNSDMVSRRHCALIIHGQEVHIRDLGSTNGTILDGERLTGDLKLCDGDIFQVGPLVFQVVIREAAAVGHSAGDRTPTPASREESQNETAKADEIVQWLISDSVNDIPASGSGVYSGKTVFTTSVPQKSELQADAAAPDRPVAGNQPASSAGITSHHVGSNSDAAHKPVEATGAAAHAAEEVLRQFLERHPHNRAKHTPK